MNEFYKAPNASAKFRKTLLTTASAVILAAYGESAQASDSDRPTVWIEGGWHFESVAGESEPFAPPLDSSTNAAGLTSLTTLEKPLGRTYGGEGSITFQPNRSDWVFAVSGRYGRVHTTRHVIDQKNIVGPQLLNFLGTDVVTPTLNAYVEGSASNSESHAILDFQVGKDIGIGLLGRGTDSIISFSARYAQMNAKSKGNFFAHPDARWEQHPFVFNFINKYSVRTYSHRSAAAAVHTDSLQALGPSISLKNTTGLLGTVNGGQLALDWGVNAGLLFGRQKAKLSHHSTVRYDAGVVTTNHIYPSATRSRSRTVTIPNIGGLETRSTTDVGFHGPYATVSIGLGG